jgi:hypothetical protein
VTKNGVGFLLGDFLTNSSGPSAPIPVLLFFVVPKKLFKFQLRMTAEAKGTDRGYFFQFVANENRETKPELKTCVSN